MWWLENRSQSFTAIRLGSDTGFRKGWNQTSSWSTTVLNGDVWLTQSLLVIGQGLK